MLQYFILMAGSAPSEAAFMAKQKSAAIITSARATPICSSAYCPRKCVMGKLALHLKTNRRRGSVENILFSGAAKQRQPPGRLVRPRGRTGCCPDRSHRGAPLNGHFYRAAGAEQTGNV
jgi:hypothetical protein